MSYGAILLAAGMSRRMGRPKMMLPWGKTSVLGQVAATLAAAHPAIEIIVVSGGARELVSAEVARLAASGLPLREVFNPAFDSGEMLSSVQAGLMALSASAAATFIALGDQPQGRTSTARELLSAFETHGARILVPSYKSRRGHPWLLRRDLWPEILALRAPLTLRDFLQQHSAEIVYTEADQTVLQDLDTLEEYEKNNPH